MPISIEHLAFSYGERAIFKDFSLTVPDGGRIWLSAPSGFGKTTLLRLICGLEIPESGAITGTAGKRVAAVFQDDRLMPWLSASENLCAVLGDLPRDGRGTWSEGDFRDGDRAAICEDKNVRQLRRTNGR